MRKRVGAMEARFNIVANASGENKGFRLNEGIVAAPAEAAAALGC